MNKTIVVVPTDPLKAYDKKGTSKVVKLVYNPNNYFDEVIILSPFEEDEFIWEDYRVFPTKTYIDFRYYLKKINPLFVRVYGSYDSCTFSIHARLIKYPVIVSIHDDRNNFIHSSIKYADKILAVSDVLKEILIKKGVDSNKITVIGNRIDYFNFKPLEEKNSDNFKLNLPKGRNILHVGKKTSQKNLDNLIKSLALLPSDVNIIAIGRGDEHYYRQLAEEHKVGHRVFFKQSIQNDHLNYYYNSCELFCVPSRNEGFGVVFIEAAAAGCKIVTSNKKPMNVILPKKFKHVFLVDDYESYVDLSTSLKVALQIPKDELINDIEELRLIHMKQFSFEAVATKEINVYESFKPLKTKLMLYLKSKMFTLLYKIRRKLINN